MRKLMLLTASAVLLGGVCALLVWRTNDERVFASSHDRRALQDQIDSLVAERDRLRSEVERARSSAPCSPAPSMSMTMTPMPGEGAAGNGGFSRARVRGGPGGALFAHLMPEQHRTMVRERYGRLLYNELSLSDAQVDALLPVLVEQDQARGTPRESMGPRDTPEAREREREIAAVIGAEKAAQFAELRGTIPARVQLRTMREDLERAGAPQCSPHDSSSVSTSSSRCAQR